MSNKYYTSLSNNTPDLIKVEVQLTSTQLAKIRRITDARASDTMSSMVKKLIEMKTDKSWSKVIKD